MTRADLAAVARGIAPVVKELLAKADARVSVLEKENAELRQLNRSCAERIDVLYTRMASIKDGAPGERGEKGDTGDPGESVVGPAGPKGEPGERGEQGPIGPDGPIGLTGEKGDQGPRGEAGMHGEKGLDGLVGPAGERGPEGPPGLLGARGEKGDIGQGLPGDRGLQGEKGLDGAPGRDGRDGLPGVQGEKGLDGRNGMDGRDGKDGLDGFGFDDQSVDPDVMERKTTMRFRQGERVKEFPLIFHGIQIYQGVYESGKTYLPGDTVSFQGGQWVAKVETSAQPGALDTGRTWQLCVMRGREGKQGPAGAQGPPGLRGEKGTDGRNWSGG